LWAIRSNLLEGALQDFFVVCADLFGGFDESPRLFGICGLARHGLSVLIERQFKLPGIAAPVPMALAMSLEPLVLSAH
jgi:hypothetical protein